SPLVLPTLSLHDALPISFEVARVDHGDRHEDHVLEETRERLLERQEQVNAHASELAHQEGRGWLAGIGLAPGARRRRQVEEVARSEEHTSELQSPDHLVC